MRTMTAKELIEQLQTVPGDTPVVLRSFDHSYSSCYMSVEMAEDDGNYLYELDDYDKDDPVFQHINSIAVVVID